MYFHDTCTLHDTSKRGPRKHITGIHCGIVVVPHKITHRKIKLQLSGTIGPELGKLLCKSNILHITSYFLTDVIYYSYILCKMQCNLQYYILSYLLNNIAY